jgi:hypothetical protein
LPYSCRDYIGVIKRRQGVKVSTYEMELVRVP